jgi:hypothetical protein
LLLSKVKNYFCLAAIMGQVGNLLSLQYTLDMWHLKLWDKLGPSQELMVHLSHFKK